MRMNVGDRMGLTFYPIGSFAVINLQLGVISTALWFTEVQ